MIFSYLVNAQLSGTTYNVFPPVSDFRSAFPAWPTIIKAQAYNQFRSGFDHLPAIVARQYRTVPLYGGTNEPPFRHQVFVIGDWSDKGFATTIQTGGIGGLCYGLNSPDVYPYCTFTKLYYPTVMGQSQPPPCQYS